MENIKMNNILKTCSVICPVGLASGTAGAVQATESGNEILSIIYMILAIIGAIGSIIVAWLAVYTKIKAKIDKAKEDGKITEDEAKEIAQTGADAIQTAIDETTKAIDTAKGKIDKKE